MPHTSHDPVRVERDGWVQTIIVDRPEVRNALNDEVARAVSAAVDAMDADDEIRVSIITGAGGTFSSGMDLKAYAESGTTPDIPGRGICGLTETPPRKPLVAAVEGWALAGGFELMLACDLVVASESAQFGLPEVKRSLIAAAGGALNLARRIPRAIALELLLAGEPIDAQRAWQVGLVNQVVPAGESLAVAARLAATIAENGPLAVRATKDIVRASEDWTHEQRWAGQPEISDPVFASRDAREGTLAFLEKRSPVWEAR